MRQMSRD